MRGPLLVHVHAEPRILSHQRADAARVVQVDVCQQQGGDVTARNPGSTELAPERRQAAAGARIDQGDTCGPAKHRRGNDARGRLKLEIEKRYAGGERCEHGSDPCTEKASGVRASGHSQPHYIGRPDASAAALVVRRHT